MRRVAEDRDESALSELYDRYATVILGSGRRLLGDRSSAEDLMQDVFVAVWKNAASFDPAKASFATWMQRITRNRATGLHRRRQRPQNEGLTEYRFQQFGLSRAVLESVPVTGRKDDGVPHGDPRS